MIQKIAENISAWLMKKEFREEDQYALLVYAIYSLILGIMPLLIIMIWGITLGMLREGLILIIPFILIRKFSGGFHLDSLSSCIVCSNFLIASMIGLIKLVVNTDQITTLSSIVVISVIFICRHSPIENKSRRLSQIEVQVFKKIARIIAIVALVIYFALLIIAPITDAISFGVGILLVALLQTPCIIFKSVKPRTSTHNQKSEKNDITCE